MIAPMRIDVVTIFPDYLDPLRHSLLGRAIERGQIEVGVHDLRTWTDDVHRTVDDTPYGGGPGMVMLPEPWGRALDALAPPGGPQPRLVVPSPAGRRFDQDDRRTNWPARTGCCSPAVATRASTRACWTTPRSACRSTRSASATTCSPAAKRPCSSSSKPSRRLLPGVLGNAQSAPDDSFGTGPAGLLEAPAYTKPATWRGLEVPPVLLSGHHGEIARWRSERSRERTAARRPDLLR